MRILEISGRQIIITDTELEDMEVLFKLRAAGHAVNQFGHAWLKPGPMCKGSLALNSGCGRCDRCRQKANIASDCGQARRAGGRD